MHTSIGKFNHCLYSSNSACTKTGSQTCRAACPTRPSPSSRGGTTTAPAAPPLRSPPLQDIGLRSTHAGLQLGRAGLHTWPAVQSRKECNRSNQHLHTVTNPQADTVIVRGVVCKNNNHSWMKSSAWYFKHKAQVYWNFYAKGTGKMFCLSTA